MLAMGVLFGIIAIIGFMWLYYSRSFKQAEVLLFQKGSLLTNQSRYLVCPKCGSAQSGGGIKSVAKLDYEEGSLTLFCEASFLTSWRSKWSTYPFR